MCIERLTHSHLSLLKYMQRTWIASKQADTLPVKGHHSIRLSASSLT